MMCALILGYFQPVRQGANVYIDGGLLCNFPVHVFDGKPFNRMTRAKVLFSKNLLTRCMLTTYYAVEADDHFGGGG